MLKKVRKWLVFVALLTVYLNIGWGLGHYAHYNMATKTFESASWHAKLLAGHCLILAEDKVAAERAEKKSPIWIEIAVSALWPFVLLFSFVSWVVHFAFWILRFIFAGGLFKLVFGIP